jgi:PAS domain S-box-containing protein/diguanylate cyclase (GGDEF)-like protein
MTLYLFSAWMLALLFTAIVGAWYGGTTALGLPLAAFVVGMTAVVLMRSLPLRRAYTERVGIGQQQVAWTTELCHSVSAPSAVVSGQVVTFANQALLAMLDFSGRSDDVVGLPFTNLIHPLDHARFAALVSEASAANSSGADAALRLVKADGSTLKTQASASPMAGAPGTLLLQFSDSAVGQLRQQGSHIAGVVLDQLELVVFATDHTGRFIYVNRAWERLSGHPEHEVRGRPFTVYLHPEDRDAVQLDLSGIIDGRLEQAAREVRLIAGNGSLHWVDLRARACVTPDGDLIGVSGTLLEITRRKRSEETTGSTRRYLNTLLANVPGMVYRGRNDPEWTMEFVSDGALDLTGYEPYELVENSRVSFGSLIHPEDREFVWSQVQSQLAQHKPYQLSYRIIDAGGEVCWVWEQGRGVFSSSGEVLAVEGFITDVSARRGAEEQAKRRLWFEARTGLTSRTIFDSLLGYVLQHSTLAGYPCALLWVDIDEFHLVNDKFGRPGGDQGLAILARRFKLVQGPGTTVTHMGGDQFAVLLTDFRLGGAARAVPEMREIIPAASQIASRLSQALALPFRIDGQESAVTASIGIAISNARYPGAEAMMAAARKAAEDARELGPGRCEFADE